MPCAERPAFGLLATVLHEAESSAAQVLQCRARRRTRCSTPWPRPKIDFRCQSLCRVRSAATSPLGHRLPVDKKFAGQTSGPSSRSSSTVLFGAIRMNREEDRSMPENGMRKRELMRPSLGEGQLQQPAPRGTYSYGRVWKQVVQHHHGVFVCWQGCGSPSTPMPTVVFPGRICCMQLKF